MVIKKLLFLLLILTSSLLLISCNSVVDSETSSLSSFTSISPSEFSKFIEQDDVVVIDVRQNIELNDLGYIPQKDLEHDFYSSDFTSFIDSLDKTERYAIYCYHDTRSGKVMSYMEEQGFEFVVDLDGGIDAWLNEGFPVDFPPSSAFN